MEEVLNIEGWKKGFRIPVANEENQRLQEELEKLILRKRNARQTFENTEERYNNLKNHLKVIQQQNEENQRLLTIYKQQMDLEESKYNLLTAEKQGTLGEIRNITKTTDDVKKRQEVKRNNINKTLQKIEKIKAELDWDAEALNTWEESLKIKKDDEELLHKFAKEDKRKINELEIRRVNLQMEMVARQKSIAKVSADVINSENILERTGKLLKELRVERASLISQWQEAARNLNRQDMNINKATLEGESVDKMIAQTQEKLEEQNKFLEQQRADNKDVELENATMNLKTSNMRKEIDGLVQFVLTVTTELNTLKHRLVSTANALENERVKSRNLVVEKRNKERKIEHMKIEIKNLVLKLSDVENSSSTAAQRAQELERMIQDEQKNSEIFAQDNGRIQAQYYRTQQVLREYQNNMKAKEIYISGTLARIMGLKKETQSTLNEVERLKETVYDIDFKINHLEEKIAKLEGASNTFDDSGVQLQQKYKELETKLTNETELRNILQRQAVVIEDEMRRLTTSLKKDSADMEALKEKLQEQITLFEVGKKQLAAIGNLSKKRRVDENVLRFRVEQMEKNVNQEDYVICDIKKYRLQLDTVMREKLIELEADKDVLLIKRRNLNDDKGRLRSDIQARIIRGEQFQKKYYIAIMTLGKDESGEPMSVTHFKIKRAQEKYMLQEEGDRLDNKVKKAEKEIIAMENTLKVVNSANVAFRNSVSAIDTEGEEFQEQKELQNDIFNLNTVLHRNKNRLTKERKLIEALKTKLAEINVEREETEMVLDKLENKFSCLQNLATERERKIRKADRHLQAISHNLDMCKIDKYNKNLLIRHLQEANKDALRRLSQLCTQFQEVSSKIHCYLDSYNVDISNSDRNKLTSVKDFDSQVSDSSRSFPSLSSRTTTVEVSKGGHSVTNVMLTFDPELCPKVCKCHRKKTYKTTQKKF